MATPPRADFDPVPPEPQASPDTRYILVELGKLSASVGWLVDAVKRNGEKNDALRQDFNGVQIAVHGLEMTAHERETKLDHVTQDTKNLRQDVNRIRQQLIFIKGMLYAIVGVLVLGGFLLSSKGDTIISLLRALPK